MLKQLIYLVLIIIVLLVSLWWTRYQVVETHTGNMPSCYKINRLTGKITWVVANQSRAVEKQEMLQRKGSQKY